MDERSAIDPGVEDSEPKQPPSIEWFRRPDTKERPAESPEHAQKSLTHWPRRIVGRFLRWIDNGFVRHSSRSVKIHVRASHAKTPRPYTFENVDTVRAIRLPQLAIAPRIVHHNDINDRLSYRLQIVGSYELLLTSECHRLVTNIGVFDSASRKFCHNDLAPVRIVLHARDGFAVLREKQS